MRAWIGRIDGMDRRWIAPMVWIEELPCVGHHLASCSLLASYVLITTTTTTATTTTTTTTSPLTSSTWTVKTRADAISGISSRAANFELYHLHSSKLNIIITYYVWAYLEWFNCALHTNIQSKTNCSLYFTY